MLVLDDADGSGRSRTRQADPNNNDRSRF